MIDNRIYLHASDSHLSTQKTPNEHKNAKNVSVDECVVGCIALPPRIDVMLPNGTSTTNNPFAA